MIRRLTTRIEEWVEDALADHALGDAVLWDLAFIPSEEGAQVALAFYLPGAILGSTVQSLCVLNHANLASRFDIDETVKSLVEDLRQSRSKQLAQVPQVERV